MSELLFATILFPVLGAVLAALSGPLGRDTVRRSALTTVLITLVMAGILVAKYPHGAAHPEPFAASDTSWLGSTSPVAVHFSLALDGLSVWLFGLAAVLAFSAVLISWESITDRPAGYYAMLLLLLSGMLGVFAARDIILFYVFFEFTLIPLFFLIGIWGSEERRHAAVKFFIFTFAGSVLTFLGLLTIVIWNYSASGELTFSIPRLTASLAAHPLPNDAEHYYLQLLVFLALFAGFAIKVPLFPLHTWLPLAHTQAPAAGSVLLAGILLKIGCYGFLRFNLAMLPAAAAICFPWLLWISVIGIVYGALLALAQTDMKRLVACSSVSHMGFVMLGIFALNSVGLQGGVLQMLNHGISTGALFALIGMLYDRYHTRRIADLGGLARRLPWLAFFMLLFTFSSIGLPGLNGFAGEFMILVGAFQRGWLQSPPALGNQLIVIAVLAVSGVVLGAWYMLWLVQRVFFGPLKEPEEHGHRVAAADHAGREREYGTGHGSAVVAGQAAAHGHAPAHSAGHGHGGNDHDGADHSHGHHAASPLPPSHVRDLSFREILALAPLAVLAVWIGVAPSGVLGTIAPSVQSIAGPIERPLQQQWSSPREGRGNVATGEASRRRQPGDAKPVVTEHEATIAPVGAKES